MLLMKQIFSKLKAMGLKRASRRKDGSRKMSPLPFDEIGYEASLLAQTEHEKKRRKR